jgi:hypothetical protein
MTRPLCAALLATLLSALACGDRTRPTEAAAAPRARATQDRTDIAFFYPEPIVSPCDGEAIALQGAFHFVGRVQYDARGGLHLGSLGNAQGVSGTGLTSGDTYRFVYAEAFQQNEGEHRADELTATLTFNVIGPGPRDNFVAHLLLHLTVSASGKLTSAVVGESLECR